MLFITFLLFIVLEASLDFCQPYQISIIFIIFHTKFCSNWPSSVRGDNLELLMDTCTLYHTISSPLALPSELRYKYNHSFIHIYHSLQYNHNKLHATFISLDSDETVTTYVVLVYLLIESKTTIFS